MSVAIRLIACRVVVFDSDALKNWLRFLPAMWRDQGGGPRGRKPGSLLS